MRTSGTREFDYIIVGAGTAGCVLARRLLDRTDATILLLESGPGYPAWALDPPLAGLRLRKWWSWPFKSIPQPQLNGRQILFPMGRVTGGSSSVNAMMHVPGSNADFEEWVALGNIGWSPGELDIYQKRAMARDGSAPLKISPPSHRARFSEYFLQACLESGLERIDGLTGENINACGYFDLFQSGGRRSGVATGYLKLIAKHPRLTRLNRVDVRRVLFENQRATGVEYLQAGRIELKRATKAVVVCAGAIMTPTLLQRSGVGLADDLKSSGIEVVHDLPGVGNSFQDHLSVPLIYESKLPSPGRRSLWLNAALQYALKRSGVMISNCCEAGCFLPGINDKQRPGIEVVTHFQTLYHRHAVEFNILLLRPESRGKIRLNPANPEGLPLIDPRYLSEPADLDHLLAGIDRLREILAQDAMLEFPLGKEIPPAATMKNTAPMRDFVAANASTAYHPCGTCRMGVDPMAVVDPHLMLRGLDGLMIADASVIPTIPTGHTAATVLMIAEKAADLLIN